MEINITTIVAAVVAGIASWITAAAAFRRSRTDGAETLTNSALNLITKMEGREKERDMRIAALEEMNEDYKKEREELSGRVQVLENHNGDLVNEVSELKVEVGDLKTKNATLKNQVETLQAEVGKLKVEVTGLEYENGQMRDGIHLLTEQLKRLNVKPDWTQDDIKPYRERK